MNLLFNVYVLGIDPNKSSDSEAIRKKTAKLFKLNKDALDKLLDSNIETCVRKKINESEAHKYQKTLSSLGLLCSLKQIAEKPTLSLVEIEKADDPDEEMFICPACQFSKPLRGNPKPLICESCGTKVALEERKIKEQKEKEEIKNRLLKSQHYRDQLAQKEAQKQAEKIRKQLLEEKVKKELGLNNTSEKMFFGSKKVVPALASICLVGALSIYQLNNKEPKQEAVISEVDNLETPISISNEQTEMADALAAANEDADALDNQNLTQEQFQQNAIPSTSQEAMADTFNKAENALNAFGLSSNNIGQGSSTQSLSVETIEQQAIIKEFEGLESSNFTEIDSVKTNNTDHTISTHNSLLENKVVLTSSETQQLTPTENTPPVRFNQLLKILNNDQKLDVFVFNRANNLAEKGKFSEAYKLAIYIEDIEYYIDAIGSIALQLNANEKKSLAHKLILQLQKKLKQQKALDPKYIAQVAMYETKIERNTQTFTQLPPLAKKRNSHLEEILSGGKIATYQYQAGLKKQAFKTLFAAKQQLNKIIKPHEKIYALLALSKSYSKIGESESSDLFVSDALSLIKQEDNLEKRSEMYCNVINTLLDIGQPEKAIELVSKIIPPEFRTLALTSIATKNRASVLLTSIKTNIQAIKLSVNRAVVASTTARKLFNSGLIDSTSELFEITEDHMSSTDKKDKVLAIIAKNYSLSGQLEKATIYLNQISQNALKNHTQKEIKKIEALTTVIS